MAEEKKYRYLLPFLHFAQVHQKNTGHFCNSVYFRYQTEIQQMMYVFGEVQDALLEVTMLVEEIVQRHTMEMIAKAVSVARRRTGRGITVDDVVFLIRHDRAKVNRLKDYLSWKDLRKNVREDSTLDNDLEDDAPGKLNWNIINCYC
jgi:transcription initiation protein SPT3